MTVRSINASICLDQQSSVATADRILRERYDHRPAIRKIIDFIISVFRQIRYSLSVRYHRLFLSNPQSCGRKIEWKSDSQGLVVLLHGLRNAPAAWYSQLGILQQHRRIDVFAPTVPKRGMCSLEEAAAPILATLLDYIQNNPGKPLSVLGVSNGSRIATWLEVKLRDRASQTPVMVSTIAGVHFGSRQMNLLEKLRLAKWFYPDSLREELKYGSDKAKELLSQLSSPLPVDCAARNYEFFASTEDISVPDLDSSLPTINKGERSYIVHGHSHDSIVTAVAKQQIASCVRWMDNQTSLVSNC
jgi:pimeloyl-ACP methyl ester carboxylesterase